MPEEVAAVIDNSDIPFERALDRVLFDKQVVNVAITTLKRMRGDYGEYWELKGTLANKADGTEAVATDISGGVHKAGSPLTLLINVPGTDASDGQRRAYFARLGELQVHGLGLAKPDPNVSMKDVEGKTVGASLSVYTNQNTGNQKQQVDRFTKAG